MLFGDGPFADGPSGDAPSVISSAMSAPADRAWFLSSERIDAATLTALTEETSLPVENLQDQRPDKTWRSTAAIGQYIDVVLDGPVACNGLAAAAVNFTDSAVWRVMGAANQANIPLAPDVDTGWRSAWPATGKPNVRNWPSFMCSLKFTNDALYRYWRVYISDTGNSYLDVGRLWLGRAFQPSANVDLNPSFGRLSPGYVRRTDYGRTYTDSRGPASRVFQIPMSSLSQRDLMDELDELQRYCGVDRDFAFCLDPAATTDLHRYSMQALFAGGSQNTAQPLWDESGNQIWQTTLTLNEVL